MPSLVLFRRPGGRTGLFNIFRRITSIGAAPDNDIVLPDKGLEDHHCQLFFDGRSYLVSTLDRKAELTVNGKKTRKATLEDGDIIRVSELTFQFGLFDVPTQEIKGVATSTKESLRRLLEFTAALTEPGELGTLLLLMLDKLIEVTGADKGFVFLVDPGNPSHPTLHVARNIDKGTLDLEERGFSDSIVQKVLRTRQPVLLSDALLHDEFSSANSVVDLRLCSVMCAPLMARGELIGVLYLGNDNVVNLFDQDGLEMLQIFSSQAGLLLKNAILIRELLVKTSDLEQRLEEIRFGELIGASVAMREVFKRVEKVAATDIGILLQGETGVGKELFAKEIHKRSGRAGGPYVAINASAIPEQLLESELFGHERGAYTGAHTATGGKFQAAHKGTLFLDEIGDLPLPLQSKILRAIEQKQVTRVGATRPENVDIRVIAATNKNLQEAVARGEFRQDLYYRLNVVSLNIPPLRERGDDISLLANYFLKRFVRMHETAPKTFSREALTALAHYAWPGNVRELENRVRKAVVLGDSSTVQPEDLELSQEQIRILPLADARDEFQNQYVARILDLNGGNRTKTARDLGVDPRTIFRYLEKERDGDSEKTPHS